MVISEITKKYKELSKCIKKSFPFSTKDERRITIFWYSYNFYNDSHDILYILKDICNYSPSPLWNFKIEREEENIKEMYKSLVKRFEHEMIFINGDIIKVGELNEIFPKEKYITSFISDSQEVEALNFNFYVNPELHMESSFDSCLLIWEVENPNKTWIFGMVNTVPFLEKEIQYIQM